MDNSSLEKLKYPIGRFEAPTIITETAIQNWIGEIAALPAQIIAAATRLSEVQLDTPYRPDGWTLRQVIHHLPDSHMNAYLRFKLAITEDSPTIKPYDEVAFAELADAKKAPIGPSLELLNALHQRWVRFLESLEMSDFSKSFFHPEHGEASRLDYNLSHYAWHGKHHLGHLTSVDL